MSALASLPADEAADTGTTIAIIEKIGLPASFVANEVTDILHKIKAAARAEETDISTVKGRAAIRSLAYKIARTKTAMDEHGKNLVADWKAKADAIDAERRRVRKELDALGEEVRKPLTDWEEAEKARTDGHEAKLAEMAKMTTFDIAEPTTRDVDDRLEAVEVHCQRDWQEFGMRAEKMSDDVCNSLLALRKRIVARDEERAELARLKAEAEEHRHQEEVRQQQEREERIAREAAERARREAGEAAEAARIAEQQRVEHERLEAERRAAAELRAAEEAARLEREAAEQRQREIEAQAQRDREAAEAERLRIERDKAAAEARALQAEQDRIASEKAAQEAAAQAERDRVAAEERMVSERKSAEERRIREVEEAAQGERTRAATIKAQEDVETKRREANKKHRANVNIMARDALVSAGLTAKDATIAIKAIAQQSVPGCAMIY